MQWPAPAPNDGRNGSYWPSQDPVLKYLEHRLNALGPRLVGQFSRMGKVGSRFRSDPHFKTRLSRLGIDGTADRQTAARPSRHGQVLKLSCAFDLGFFWPTRTIPGGDQTRRQNHDIVRGRAHPGWDGTTTGATTPNNIAAIPATEPLKLTITGPTSFTAWAQMKKARVVTMMSSQFTPPGARLVRK